MWYSRYEDLRRRHRHVMQIVRRTRKWSGTARNCHYYLLKQKCLHGYKDFSGRGSRIRSWIIIITAARSWAKSRLDCLGQLQLLSSIVNGYSIRNTVQYCLPGTRNCLLKWYMTSTLCCLLDAAFLLAKSCEAAAALRPVIVSVNFNRQLGNLRLFFFVFVCGAKLQQKQQTKNKIQETRLDRPPSQQMFHLNPRS